MYYILLSGQPTAGAGESFTLSAAVVTYAVAGVSATTLGQGICSTTISGTGFTQSSVVTLLDGSGNVVATATGLNLGKR